MHLKGGIFLLGKRLKNIRLETGYHTTNGFTDRTETITKDVWLLAGKVQKLLDPADSLPGAEIIDGQGALLVPQLREMHCHFDKSKLGVPWYPIETAENITERFNKEFDYLEKLPQSFASRMKNLIDLELSHGVTRFRSHIDIHPKVGQRYLEQAQAVLADYQGKLDYELVAFPQHGLLLSKAYDEMKKALQNGATIVGGVDPLSLDQDLDRSLGQTFDLAVEFDAPIDIHIHERGDAARETFQKILALTQAAGWQNKVTVSHAYGLRDLDPGERAELFPKLAANGITIISSVPLDFHIPPLMELRDAGVNVFLGCDNIYDCWSPFGDGDIMTKLNRFAEIFQQTSQIDLTEALDLVTDTPVIDPEGWLKPEMPASFTLVDASSTAEFVARQKPVQASYLRGQRVL